MDVRYFNEFIALAQCLNFSLAAESCFVSQSVLSRHISAIEDELGVRLFIRNKHPMTITEEGKLFLASAENIISEYDSLLNQLSIMKSGFSGSLKVGIYHHAIERYLTPVFGEFQKQYPQIALEIFLFDPVTLTEALIASRIDVGIVVRSEFNPYDNFVHHKVGREAILVAMNEKHPCANLPHVAISQLKDEHFIYTVDSEDDDSIKDKIVHSCQKYGFTPENFTRTSSIETLLLAIRNNNMISFVTEHIKDVKVPGVVFVKLHGPEAYWEVCVSHKKENGNAIIPVFIEYCRDIMSKEDAFVKIK